MLNGRCDVGVLVMSGLYAGLFLEFNIPKLCCCASLRFFPQVVSWLFWVKMPSKES